MWTRYDKQQLDYLDSIKLGDKLWLSWLEKLELTPLDVVNSLSTRKPALTLKLNTHHPAGGDSYTVIMKQNPFDGNDKNLLDKSEYLANLQEGSKIYTSRMPLDLTVEEIQQYLEPAGLTLVKAQYKLRDNAEHDKNLGRYVYTVFRIYGEYPISDRYTLVYDRMHNDPLSTIQVRCKNYKNSGRDCFLSNTVYTQGKRILRIVVRLNDQAFNLGELTLRYILKQEKPSAMYVVRHYDGDIFNNMPDNVYWGTRADVMQEINKI